MFAKARRSRKAVDMRKALSDLSGLIRVARSGGIVWPARKTVTDRHDTCASNDLVHSVEAKTMSLPFSVEALLRAISGIAYVVDREGIILGFSRGPFLPDPTAPETAMPDYSHAVGTSVFSIVHGEPVRRSYRVLHEAACSERSDAFGFAYRCDSPDVERHMFMSISRIQDGTRFTGVLYQSIVISEMQRPPLPLFAFELHDSPAAEAERIVTLCSYCQMVAWPAGSAGTPREWIDAVEFYRRGGRSDAVVSHGVCEACLARIVEPVRRAMANT